MTDCFLPSYGKISHLVGRAENYNDAGRPKKFDDEVKEQIRQDRLSGMTLREIAAKYGCSRQFVCLEVKV
jgi:hypothetical protein